MGNNTADYKETLLALQVELVKLQKHFIKHNEKILVILEGRDAAGKDGLIKRVIQHLSPRDTRVVALGKPSDREKSEWYFQRYVPHLPSAQEFVLFNRSWYNRAGVERVMGFCTDAEYEEFMDTVPNFEQMLVRSGIHLFKYYLDIHYKEQKHRLESRAQDPLKQWKISPIDKEALKYWDDYSRARNEMLIRTHSPVAPWTIVNANDKKTARLNVIKDILAHLSYHGKNEQEILRDPQIIFSYKEEHLTDGMVAA